MEALTVKALDVVGEKKFLRICQEFELSPSQIEIVRAILAKWDELPLTDDYAARQKKKRDVVAFYTNFLGGRERENVLSVLFRVSNLFATLREQRQ